MSKVKWPLKEVAATIDRMDRVGEVLKETFTARDEAIDMLVLAAVCHEHILLIGPPGTAKTALISQFANLIDATGFHYLITRYTEPSELFGPLDLERFRSGDFQVHTAGMLPESQIVFLDELFQGASPILNSLLSILNERRFHNGSERQRVPLISLIGASNVIPEDPWLSAFGDRFVLRLEVDSVGDERVDDLLDLGWDMEQDRITQTASGEDVGEMRPLVKNEDLKVLHSQLKEIQMEAIRPQYAALIRELRSEGVSVSDRRAVRGLRLVAGSALLRKSRTPTPIDFKPLRHLWTRVEESERVRDLVNHHMSQEGGVEVEPERSEEDIRRYLDTILERAGEQHSQAARIQRMSAINDLKREVYRDHPQASELRKRIDEAIENEIRAMETAHV